MGKLALLRKAVRSAMRTANRRLQDYASKGVEHPRINSLLNNIEYRKFFNKDTGRLTMKNLSERDLSELLEVQKTLKDIPTEVKYEKSVRKMYEENADLFPDGADVDVNLFTRSLESFYSKHGDKYKDWGDWVVEHSKIESKGDTLAQEYRKILQEYSGKELSTQEVESILSQRDGFEKF